MSKSKIEWCDRVWNPVTGCTRVSPGCDNCYAIRQSHRFAGVKGSKFEGVTALTPAPLPEGGEGIIDWSGKVVCHEDLLEMPLRWRKPQRVFVNSMSDLFHDDVPDEFICKVFSVMLSCPSHTFMVLTKRPLRMKVLLNRESFRMNVCWNRTSKLVSAEDFLKGTTPNIWLGVSCENQAMADQRIPHLLKTPAAVRFVSYEPALGAIDFQRWLQIYWSGGINGEAKLRQPGLDWIICGGESGPGARPMHPDWARSVRDQCKAVGVAFFFKQWGEYQHYDDWNILNRPVRSSFPQAITTDDGQQYVKLGKKAAGRLLNGVEHSEFPNV